MKEKNIEKGVYEYKGYLIEKKMVFSSMNNNVERWCCNIEGTRYCSKTKKDIILKIDEEIELMSDWRG